MKHQQLKDFIDLITFDQNLFSLENSIKTSKNSIELWHSSMEIEKQKIEKKHAELLLLEKTVKAQEISMQDLESKEKAHAETSYKSKNVKEADAAHQELEYIKIEKLKLEKKLMQSMQSLQNAQKEYELLVQEHEKRQLDIKQKIQQESDSIARLQENIVSAQQERCTKKNLVPAEWMALYEKMKGKVINPVVPVAYDSCSACFYSVSSRDLQLLKHNNVIACKDCYRFLYIESMIQVQDAS